MRAVEIKGGFGIDNLTLVERLDPAPGFGQVAIRIKAASLNYRDLLTVNGFYNPRQPLPLIPCSDGVGEIIACGEGVTQAQVGDRVAGIFAQGWRSGRPTREKLLDTTLGGPLDGMLAEVVVLNEAGIVPVPDHLSDEEAATLPCAGLTAWSALRRHGNVAAGDRVLVLGTGGVSIFALQFARMLGAEVMVTSSSDEKLARAKELGATHGINYGANPSWAKEVRALTDGEGVDHIIEVGGAGTLSQSLRCVRMGGTISLIGVLAGPEHPVNLTPALMQDIRIQGVIVGHGEAFLDMNRAIRSASMKPIVDRVFPLEETQDAFRLMAEAGHFGKIVVRVSA